MQNIQKNKKRVVFISESIRRDCHFPLRYLNRYEVMHFYLKAPYGDLKKEDLAGSKKVALRDLLDEIIKAKPDIIQGTEPFGSRLSLRLSYICLKAKLKTGSKLVAPILENRPIGERFNVLERIILRMFCPKYFRVCDALVALNKGAVVNIKHYFKGANIKTGIIWGVWGVDLTMFKPIGRRNKNEIVYIGRIIEDKGLRYLIEGFAKSVKLIPDLKLRIGGSGDLEDELKQYVDTHGLAKNVEFMGYVGNEDIVGVFSRASLCVYPSITMRRWEEQVGTVNFQALACGTPILTTKSGAIPEYIKEGEGAMLVKEKSAEAIAKAIESFFTNSALRVKLLNSARNAARQYDVRVEIEKAQELFDELV